MDAMSQANSQPDSAPTEADTSTDGTHPQSGLLEAFKAASARRALLLTALGGLLIAGLITALPVGSGGTGLAAYLEPAVGASGKPNANFAKATAGDCLNWPDKTPDAATIVSCADDHRFEVAEAIDMSTFPGSEYGPNAAPPSPTRIQQISAEQCQVAVQHYLGAKYDPNSRYTVSMLWSGDKAWKQSGERRMLCGLQLPGPDNQQLAFKGKVADVDQSKVWPTGTCLGIDPTTNQPTDIPVDCAAAHAMEVTGTVNLAEKFPGPLPSEADQDAFIKDSCNKMTDAYLAPVALRSTTLTLIYSTISLPSWSAGSHQVACSIGATLGNGGWAALLNSAKGPLMINGMPPVPPPDIPADRLNLPPIPMPDPSSPQYPSYDGSSDSSSSSSSSGSSSSGSGSTGSTTSDPAQQTQHLPNQPATQTPSATVPPPAGNTFNPPPPGAPPMDAPPMDSPPADVPPPLFPPPAPVEAPPADVPVLGPAPGPAA